MSYYWRIECPVCNRGPYVHRRHSKQCPVVYTKSLVKMVDLHNRDLRKWPSAAGWCCFKNKSDLAIWFEEYLIALDEAYFVIAKYDVEGKFINKRGLQCYVSADNMSVEVNPSLKEVIPISDLINML